MWKKRFSVEQMIGVLKQAEVGVPVAEVIRKAGISEQTFYRWKAKYAGLEVDQVRQMAQLQEKNLRPKKLVAGLTLDNVNAHLKLTPLRSSRIDPLVASKRDKLTPERGFDPGVKLVAEFPFQPPKRWRCAFP